MNKYLKFFLPGLLLMVIPVSCLMAQQLVSERAVIVMVNGNHISGRLYFNVGDSSFIIKPASAIMMTVPMNVIKSMTLNPGHLETVPAEGIHRIYNNTSLGLAIGKNNESVNGAGNITAETVFGIVFKPWLHAGLGIGYDQYDLSAVVPYFISVSGDLVSQSFTPFYYFEAGTSAAWPYKSNGYYYSQYANAEGKSMIQFGIGYRVYLNNAMNFGFSIGYRNQEVTYSTNYGIESVISNVTYRRVVFKMEIGF